MRISKAEKRELRILSWPVWSVPQPSVDHAMAACPLIRRRGPRHSRGVLAALGATSRPPSPRTEDPLEHREPVTAIAFSPDGARVVTASADNSARVWELPMDAGSLADWQRRARCAPFALDNGVLVENHSSCP
jgi:WD40 repeat protein